MPIGQISHLFILNRYHQIMTALNDERQGWDDGCWMRFAAQIAVSTPSDAFITATLIRQHAAELRSLVSWFESLTPPKQLLIAALVMQMHVPLSDFPACHLITRSQLDTAGIACDQFDCALVTLIMSLAPVRSPMSEHDACRIRDIHQLLVRRHSWQSGPGDVPACAALALLSEDPEIIVTQIGNAYQELLDEGLAAGSHLWTAVILLMLAGNPVENEVLRFHEIRECLELRDGAFEPEPYVSSARLALLDFPPDMVVNNFLSLRNSLFVLDPELTRTLSLSSTATDLAVLYLINSGSGDGTQTDGVTTTKQRDLLAFHLASIVVLGGSVRAVANTTPGSADPLWPITDRPPPRLRHPPLIEWQ